MFNWVRGLVSLNKKRFQEEGYDLDLAYIGDRIIAMGYPAFGFESCYRNAFPDVKKFLDSHHQNKYWVYNLCSERSYDPSVFEGRVSCFPFEDHNPPKFDMMRQFCVHAKDFLDRDPENIVVVHCKAGKGRTGVMICALLIHMRTFAHAIEALQSYGRQRTNDEKGVTIPSQRRYVFYYEKYLSLNRPTDQEFQPSPVRVTRVVFKNVPKKYFTRSLAIQFQTIPTMPPIKIETHGVNGEPVKDHENVTLDYDLGEIFPKYAGDFRIAALKGDKKIWYMWFNSEFILPVEEFGKQDIDKICKDKTFGDDFRMIVYTDKV